VTPDVRADPQPPIHTTGYCQTLPIPRVFTLAEVNARWAEVWARVDSNRTSNPNGDTDHD